MSRSRSGGRFLAQAGAALFAAIGLIAGLAWFARVASERPVAPAFQLVDHSGQRQRLADYRGRILVLNFWAPWCGPCRREIPLLDAMARRLAPRGVQVLGVAVDTSPAALSAALAARPVGYPIVAARPDHDLQARYAQTKQQASILPLTVIVDRSGRIASRLSGELTAQRLDQALLPLLGVDPASKPALEASSRAISAGAGVNR